MKKKQGYNARLDESLGARNKTKGKQSLKSRRKESEGMEKSKGRRKYAAVGTMGKAKKTSAKTVKRAKGGMAARINKQAQLTTCEGMLKNETGEELAERTEARRKMERGGGRIAAVGTMDKGKKTLKRKTGGRVHSPTAIRLNMGAPKVKTITARGMGAALRGGQFRENT